MTEKHHETPVRSEVQLSAIREKVSVLVEQYGSDVFSVGQTREKDLKRRGKRAVVVFEEGLNPDAAKNTVLLFAGRVHGEVKIVNIEDQISGRRIRTDYTIGSEGKFIKRVLRSKPGNNINAFEPYYGLDWAREEDLRFLGMLVGKIEPNLHENGSQDASVALLTPQASHSHPIRVLKRA